MIAKFKLIEMHHFAPNDPDGCHVNLKFSAVYGNGKENKDWSKWTPSGEITITVTNPNAIEPLEIGAEYFVTFQPAVDKADSPD